MVDSVEVVKVSGSSVQMVVDAVDVDSLEVILVAIVEENWIFQWWIQ